MEQNFIAFEIVTLETMYIVDNSFLSYLRISTFFPVKYASILFFLNFNTLENNPWSVFKGILDKVHQNLFVHASYADFQPF